MSTEADRAADDLAAECAVKFLKALLEHPQACMGINVKVKWQDEFGPAQAVGHLVAHPVLLDAFLLLSSDEFEFPHEWYDIRFADVTDAWEARS